MTLDFSDLLIARYITCAEQFHNFTIIYKLNIDHDLFSSNQSAYNYN